MVLFLNIKLQIINFRAKKVITESTVQGGYLLQCYALIWQVMWMVIVFLFSDLKGSEYRQMLTLSSCE